MRVSPAYGNRPIHGDVQEALRGELLNLSFHGFEEVVRQLLTELGYSNARLLGRTQWRQFTRHGGMDMEATATVGLSASRVILQLKQYRRPVSRRFIDELSGVILRSHAREGIVISTSSFSRVAKLAAAAQRVAPIRLIDGHQLTSLLVKHQIGVSIAETAQGEPVVLDKAFFQALRDQYPLKSRADSRRIVPDSGKPSAGLRAPQSRMSKVNHMLWRTHLLAGISSLWLLSAVPGVLSTATIPEAVLMASLGALLPDLDAADSRIRHLGAFGITPFAPISALLHRRLGHRGILHSPIVLIPVAALAAALSLWLGSAAGLSLLLGFSSHLAADAMTRSGIPLVPFSRARLHLLPPSLRIVTGGMGEDVFMVLTALMALLLLLHYLLLFSPSIP